MSDNSRHTTGENRRIADRVEYATQMREEPNGPIARASRRVERGGAAIPEAVGR